MVAHAVDVNRDPHTVAQTRTHAHSGVLTDTQMLMYTRTQWNPYQSPLILIEYVILCIYL